MFTLASSQPQDNMIGFILLGFTVVLFILLLLSGVTSIVGLFFKMKDKAEANKPSQAATQQSQAVPAETMDASLLAAISAAVFVALSGEKYNIVSIRALPSNLEWSAEGKRNIFQSHKIR